MLSRVRIQMVVEEHGAGRQLARFRAWPSAPPVALSVLLGLAMLAAGAAGGGAMLVAAVLGVAVLVGAVWMFDECARSMSAGHRAWGVLACKALVVVKDEQEEAGVAA